MVTCIIVPQETVSKFLQPLRILRGERDEGLQGQDNGVDQVLERLLRGLGDLKG